MAELVIKEVDIGDLKLSEYNPRKLSDKQKSDLKKSLATFGFVDPIVINSHPKRKNYIIGGHQRVTVAQEMYNEGVKIKGTAEGKVPVVELNLTQEKEKELNIRLNKNVGDWDLALLEQHFDLDDLVDYGFDERELSFMDEIPEPPELEDVDTTDHKLNAYTNATIKQIVLFYENEKYADMLNRLEEITIENDLGDNSEAVEFLVKFYEDNSSKED